MKPSLAAAAASAVLALASPAAAGVYSVSTPVSIPEFEAGVFLTLPKYSGPETIRRVAFNLKGQTYLRDDYFNPGPGPLTIPAQPVNWLLALEDWQNGFPILTEFLASEIPAITLREGAELYVYTPLIDVNRTEYVPHDLYGFYAGNDDATFLLMTGLPGEGFNGGQFNGVLTMTILTGVPELDTWGLMLLGVFGAGAALRRRRSAAAAEGVAAA
jgi:hypothetical protein